MGLTRRGYIIKPGSVVNEALWRKFRKILFPLIITTALTMRIAAWETLDASFFVLAGYALLGLPQAIQALFFSWLFLSFNQGLVLNTPQNFFGHYIVMMGAAISVFIRIRFTAGLWRNYQAVILTMFLGLYLVLHSFMFSPFKDVSILKAFSWTLVMITLLTAWINLDYGSKKRLEGQLFAGLIATSMLSLPLLATDIGYFRDGRGFQGILSHPQTFGLLTALWVVWLIGHLVERSLPWWQKYILGIGVILIIFSRARTAWGALLIGILFTLILFLLVNPRIIRARLLSLGMGGMAIILFIAAGMVIGSFVVNLPNELIRDFLLKQSDASNIIEAIELSRGQIYYSMIDNIKLNPLSGIGFGIGSDPWLMVIKRHDIYSLPTSAPIEKAAMPLAVIEEIGIPGFIIVGIWFWVMLRRAAIGGFTRFLVLTTVILINFGEFVLFSPGGFGLVTLILVAWASGPHVRIQ